MKTMVKGLLGGLFLIAAGSGAYGASFDCKKALTGIENQICTDPKLSALDDELAGDYKKALTLSSNPSAMKEEQRRWMKEERNASRDPVELEAAYLSRIEAIRLSPEAGRKLFARNEPPKSIFGRYSQTEPLCFNPKEGADEYDCQGDVESYLDIRQGTRNAVKIKGELWFFNGHQCGPFEAEGEWAGDVLRVPMLEEYNRCVLLLRFEGGRVITSDPGGRCKEAFLCGANASFYSIELPRLTDTGKRKQGKK